MKENSEVRRKNTFKKSFLAEAQLFEQALGLEGIRLEFNEYSSYLHIKISWEACTKYIPKEISIQWMWAEALEPVLLAGFLDYSAKVCYIREQLE